MFELYESITVVTFIIAMGVAAVIIPLLLTQYYIHKKILDPTYYNTDHFSAGELVILTTGFVFYIHKTLIYVRAIALPKTMRTRFNKDILTFKDRPFVYLLAWFTLLLIAYGGIALINAAIFLFIYENYI